MLRKYKTLLVIAGIVALAACSSSEQSTSAPVSAPTQVAGSTPTVERDLVFRHGGPSVEAQAQSAPTTCGRIRWSGNRPPPPEFNQQARESLAGYIAHFHNAQCPAGPRPEYLSDTWRPNRVSSELNCLDGTPFGQVCYRYTTAGDESGLSGG